MAIKDQLGKQFLFFDGAMGTLLQQNGLMAGELPELWNIKRPDIVEAIHASYFRAGCDITKANTFGANALKLKDSGYSVQEVIEAGITLARRAAREESEEKPRYVALDIGPTGKLLKPLGDLPFEGAYALFAEMMIAGEEAGADLVLIETMSDTYEVKAAVLAAKENTSLPVFATMVFDEKGKLLTGADVAATVALLEGLGVDALGLNCALGPEQMKDMLVQVAQYASLPIIINPNAGLPESREGKTVFNVTPESFAHTMGEIAGLGASVLGGCCGTTPLHLQKMIETVGDRRPCPPPKSGRTIISSYARAVEFGPAPVLIGERINPTGKKLIKQALQERDLDYIFKEGIYQQQAGAHVLDVNVGLPGIDEPVMMEEVVCGLQGVTDLPLVIDTSDPLAMERGLRHYNGKALINSANGKTDVMEQVFPLAKKYGGVVVCLTLDENGIPDTAQGRYEIAQKIVCTAASFGIEKKDLIIDVLAMTVSAQPESAKVGLQAAKLVKELLGVKTMMGVSNISFGLPQRGQLNASYLTMGLYAGLDAAIVNPLSDEMMRAYDAYLALMDLDPGFQRYLSRYGAKQEERPKPESRGGAMTLYDAIVGGLKDSARKAADGLLETQEPLDIVNHEMVPALDQVGKGFEQGTIFLPQLLMSAEAAKSAFEIIRLRLEQQGTRQDKAGRIVLATVKGDIHDIGKNIVKVLLENYNFDVIDLGKDVEPDAVVNAAKETGAALVGLSALMTTTVTSMEETIKRLKAELPGCKVMVGGAVLNPEYARAIGADFYSKDAMGSVHIAQELFG